jgi:hypothetical protein
MRTFVITTLVIMALECLCKLHMVHRILQGDGPIVREPRLLLVDVACTIGVIAWGMYVLD